MVKRDNDHSMFVAVLGHLMSQTKLVNDSEILPQYWKTLLDRQNEYCANCHKIQNERL